MTERPEWLTALLPEQLPELKPGEEACFGVHYSVFRRLGMRPRHHWDRSPRIDHGKDFCLRCELKRCQVGNPEAKTKKKPQCERRSRHPGKHQSYRDDGRVSKEWGGREERV